MKFTIKDRDKTVPYAFPNKAAEREYVETCLDIWGCVPVEVDWAKGTRPYQDAPKRAKANL